jgi:hypothetical protein
LSALMGVAGGADPLHVVEQNFFAMGQSTPVAGATRNMITVTLISTTGLAATDVVTISGLSGAVGPTSATDAATLFSVDGGNSGHSAFYAGAWDNTNKKLRLTVATGQTVDKKKEYRFSFALANPGTEQGSPPVSIEAWMPVAKRRKSPCLQ